MSIELVMATNVFRVYLICRSFPSFCFFFCLFFRLLSLFFLVFFFLSLIFPLLQMRDRIFFSATTVFFLATWQNLQIFLTQNLFSTYCSLFFFPTVKQPITIQTAINTTEKKKQKHISTVEEKKNTKTQKEQNRKRVG